MLVAKVVFLDKGGYLGRYFTKIFVAGENDFIVLSYIYIVAAVAKAFVDTGGTEVATKVEPTAAAAEANGLCVTLS